MRMRRLGAHLGGLFRAALGGLGAGARFLLGGHVRRFGGLSLRAILPARLATDSPDLRHVLPILAHGAAAFAASLARLVRGELMCGPFLVCSAAPLARDLPLLRGVHRREAPVALL